MRRRTLLAAALAAPAIAQGQARRVLRFVPYVDLSILDPITNTATVTRNHGHMVFDTLYGMDEHHQPQFQMLDGHLIEDDHRRWTLVLREGLRFHDGEPVRARDAVASIRRWAAKDMFGATLLAVTEELTALDDRRLRFRLNRPFPLLPVALGKIQPSSPFIMPERLAETDPNRAISEMVGSGPFRFLAEERVPGARAVYERFEDYVPRADGPAGLTSGPKRVHLDRVEWLTMPDPSTAAGALLAGEIDWWEAPSFDLLPRLRRDRGVRLALRDRNGLTPVLRFNSSQPPFDNPLVRRAVLGAVDQAEFMAAFSADRELWHVKVGAFTPNTPMASEAGLEGLFGPTDVAKAKRALAEAGYGGERVVLMAPTDHPTGGVIAQVTGDLFRRIGLNLDYQAMDAGTMFQRRTNRQGVDRGGWSAFPSQVSGDDMLNPATTSLIRGNGAAGWYGWPTSPRLEALREAWFATGELTEQQRICAEIQLQLWQDAPHFPVGQLLPPTAFRRGVENVPVGFPKFWSVTKSA
jgi:peptide/nickel transport system substrate-binding protein